MLYVVLGIFFDLLFGGGYVLCWLLFIVDVDDEGYIFVFWVVGKGIDMFLVKLIGVEVDVLGLFGYGFDVDVV